MKGQPNKIYLQTGIEEVNYQTEFKDLGKSGITWNTDKIFSNDLEYISANHIKKVIKDRLNHLKSDLRYLKNPKMGTNDDKEFHKFALRVAIEEQYWLLHKLGLVKK